MVQASLTSTSHAEPCNQPCGVARCKTSPIQLAMNAFFSHTAGEQLKVMIRASCKSSSVIYIICRRCGQQYVGETGQPLHWRMNDHCSDILQGRTEVSPVATHFNIESHSQADMIFMVIDQVYTHDPCLRKTWESRWIRTLRTSSLLGMNLWVNSQWSLLALFVRYSLNVNIAHVPEEGRLNRSKRATNVCFCLFLLYMYILSYDHQNWTVNLHMATKSGLVIVYRD